MGASIYDVRTEGGGEGQRGQKIAQICSQTLHKFSGGGGQKSKNFADVICGSP